MVKFDASFMRYLDKDQFRVLTAIEMGMRNHELVPKQMIANIAGIRGAGAFRGLVELHKNKLVWHSSAPYDGFKLTYLGYDFLALNTFQKRNLVTGVGRKIGTGKESDIYIVNGIIKPPKAPGEESDDDDDDDEEEEESLKEIARRGPPPTRNMALKLHRLGRTSFRAVKSKRDYLKNRKTSNWLYLSRLAAMKEYAFMKVLHDHGFPVPEPISVNRHAVLMELCEGTRLANVTELQRPGDAYEIIMELIVRLGNHGLIHCDCNEFNLILKEDEETGDVEIKLIDFPQMVSTSHINAEFYFDRDVNCIRTFFKRRFNFESELYPVFTRDIVKSVSLDVEVAASGYNPTAENDSLLESVTEAHNIDGERSEERDYEDEEGGEEEEEEEVDDDENEDKDDEEEENNDNEEDDDKKESDENEDDDEENEEYYDEQGGIVIDKKQIIKSAQNKVGIKHKAPVRKLGHTQKNRKKRLVRDHIKDSIF